MTSAEPAGFTAIWNDVLPEGRDNLYEWHNREHMPERLAIPGFRRGRRFVAVKGAPEYFILYEADRLSVLGGPDYFRRLNDPTPWTSRSQKNFRNSLRSVCSVAFERGTGMGGYALVLRSRAEQAPAPSFAQAMAGTNLPAIELMTGVTAVRLGICDYAISTVDTTEKRGRVPFGNPGWVLIAEAVSSDILEAIAETRLTPEVIAATGGGDMHDGIYRMEFCRTN